MRIFDSASDRGCSEEGVWGAHQEGMVPRVHRRKAKHTTATGERSNTMEEAEAFVAALSAERRAELCQLLASGERSGFSDQLRDMGVKKLGTRLKVEMLLQQPAEMLIDVGDCSTAPPQPPGNIDPAPAISPPAEAAAEKAVAAASATSTFFPAAAFAGKRSGCVFKMDTKGLGYYRDMNQPDARLKSRMLGNMSWLSEDPDEAESEASTAEPASAAAPSPAAVMTLALPGAAPKAPPEPGRLSKERKAKLQKQAGPFAPDLKEGKYAEKGEVVWVNGKKWGLVQDIKTGSYEVVFWDDKGIHGKTTCHFSELETTTLSLKRFLIAKQKWDARAPLAKKSLEDDKRGHVHKSWTGPSINELRIVDKSAPGKGYYAGVVPSVPVLMPPRLDPADVKAEGGEEVGGGGKSTSGYYYAHRRKIDFKVPTPTPTPL